MSGEKKRSDLKAEKTHLIMEDCALEGLSLLFPQVFITEGNKSYIFTGEGYETFDAMNLSEKLLQGIYAYGYRKPSVAQEVALGPLCVGRHLLVLGESNPLKSSTICIRILQQMDYTTDECQALVVTDCHSSTLEIGKDMLALGKFLGVKVHVIGGPSSAPTPTGAHVVLGTLHHVRSLLRRMELSTEYIQTVVVDEPVHMSEHEVG